ncbi:Stk17bp [Marasmius crinis-equi]|uniref:Stk17bp n=1 Tax=Marasmius crinis-equi TaxID=585013 RepID=A0ABR3FBF7_9AGAR
MRPFPVTNEIPKELPEVMEIHPILETTIDCSTRSPSDGSCINLVIEEPLCIDRVPEDMPEKLLRSREVTLYLTQYDAQIFPMKEKGTDLVGFGASLWTKASSTFKMLQKLGIGSHHIATLLFPPFLLPNGDYLITMPHYGFDLELAEGSRFSGNVIHRAIRQILAALQFLHSNYLFHLDIKPQNIALADDSPDFTIIDLGWMMECESGYALTYAAGTSGWVSPQVQRCHDYQDEDSDGAEDDEVPPPYSPRKADVWAIGRLILYLTDKNGAEPDDYDRLRGFAEWLMSPEEEDRPPASQALELFNERFPDLSLPLSSPPSLPPTPPIGTD